MTFKRVICTLGAGLVAAWALMASVATAAERGLQRPWLSAAADAAPDAASAARVIVKYRAGSALRRAQAVGAAATGGPGPALPRHAAALGARLRMSLIDGRVLGTHTQALRGQGLSSAQLAARLAGQPDVEWAVPDQRRRAGALPNDPYFGPNQTLTTPVVGQWYLRAPDATAASAINAVGAWELTQGSSAITVAVLDTGVRYDHPELAGKLHPGYDFIADRATANDNNGRDSDASDPGDWTNADQCSPGERASASSWHGTQVAGLIGAASDNGVGMASVGRNVMVLPVRVLGRCGGFDSDIIAAMRWAAGISSDPVRNPHPARVINLSLGSSGACEASYIEAMAELTAAGVVVVAAAGNAAGLAVEAPGNCPGVIAVGGLRHLGSKVGYSSLGPEVALSAPAGNCVNLSGACLYSLLSTTNSGSAGPLLSTYSTSFKPTLGTSFSSPLVAGVVGLMLSVDAGLTPAKVRAILQASARRFPSTGAEAGVQACSAPSAVEQLECYCTTATCGAGLLDAGAAVLKVKQATAEGQAADRIFRYLEASYPQYISPGGPPSGIGLGYYYRYYAATNSYVGVKDGKVYYLVPAIRDEITLLGSVAEWLAITAAAGY